MANISFKTLEVWNIERAGNTKSVELIAIFNVDHIENRLKYSLFDSHSNLISSLVFPRDYRKGEAVYPKFFETDTPDGVVTMTAFLVDSSNEPISEIVAKTLYLKKAQPASGIGQRALENPTFNLPEFPEATVEASVTAQNAELVAEKVEQDREEVYVSSQEAIEQLRQEEPGVVTTGLRSGTIKYDPSTESGLNVGPTEKPFEKPSRTKWYEEPEVITDVQAPAEDQDFLPPVEEVTHVTTDHVQAPSEETAQVTTADVQAPTEETAQVTTADVQAPAETVAGISWFGDTWFPYHFNFDKRRR